MDKHPRKTLIKLAKSQKCKLHLKIKKFERSHYLARERGGKLCESRVILYCTALAPNSYFISCEPSEDQSCEQSRQLGIPVEGTQRPSV